MTETQYRKVGLVLPAETVETLRSASTTERNLYIAALARGQWSHASIATALDLSRERVRQIAERHADDLTPDVLRLLGPLPEPPKRERASKPRTSRPDPDPGVIARLLELQPEAQKVRAGSDAGREAAEEYTRILFDSVQAGVPLTRLGKSLGVTPGALRSRLVRYGYIETDSDAYGRIVNENRPLLGVVSPI